MIEVRIDQSRSAVSINGRRLDLEQPIYDVKRDVVILDDRVVILMSGDDYAEDDMNVGRNVICVDAEARIKWRIAPSGIGVKNASGKEIPEPYSGVSMDRKRDTLCVYIPLGICVDVDTETGKTSNPQQRLFG